MRSTMALKTDLDGLGSLFRHFPSLEIIRFSSYEFRRYQSGSTTHVATLRRATWTPAWNKNRQAVPTYDLPSGWIIDSEETELLFTSSVDELASRAPNCLDASVQKIVWEGGTSHFVRFASKQAYAGLSLRALRICSSREDNIDVQETVELSKWIGNSVEELDLGVLTEYLSLRDVFRFRQWQHFKRLRILRIPCWVDNDDDDDLVDVERSRPENGPLLEDRGPCGRREIWSVPVHVWDGPPLKLEQMTLVLCRFDCSGAENDLKPMYAMLDYFPRFPNLARAMIAIRGPSCQYTLELARLPGCPKTRHLFQQTINVMLRREIQHQLGRAILPRVEYPEWMQFP